MDTKQSPSAIHEWFERVSFDFQTVPGASTAADIGKAVMDSTLIKVLTNVIVNVCAALWSFKELYDYFVSRQSFKEIIANVGSTAASGSTAL